MTVNLVDIPFPLEGLNRATGFTDQPLRTSRDMLNVSGVDHSNQRVRGVQREGISNFLATPAAAGNKIRRMETLVRNERRITYSNGGTSTLVWGRQVKRANTGGSIARVSQSGNVFALSGYASAALGAASWSKYNSYGHVMWWQRIEVPVPPAALTNPQCQITGFWVDEAENVYASTGIFTKSDGTTELTTVDFNSWSSGTPGRIWKWSPNSLGTGYDIAWSLTLPANYTCTDIIVKDGVLYTLQTKAGITLGAAGVDTKIVWYGDIDGTNPPDDTLAQKLTINATNFGGAAIDIIGRSFAIRDSDGIEFIVAGGTRYIDTIVVAAAEERFLFKINTYGTIRYQVRSSTAGANDGAFGNGIAVDQNGDLISSGYAGATQKVWLKKYADSGASITPQWTSADAGQVFHDMFQRFAVDQYGNTYIGQNAKAKGVFVFDANGNQTSSSSALYYVNSTAIPPSGPLYMPAFLEDDPKIAEFVYTIGQNKDPSGFVFVGVTWTAATKTLSLGGGFGGYVFAEGDYVHVTAGTGATAGYYAVTASTATTITLATAPGTTNQTNYQISIAERGLSKYQVLTSTASAGSPRSTVGVVLAPPNIKIFTRSGGFVTPGGTLGGTSCINSSARYVSSAALLGKLFVTDGSSYVYVDPTMTTNYPNGRVERWEPTSSGVMPPRAKLVFAWRDRIGMSLCPDDPHNIYLTATNNPFDIDIAPVSPTITQAMVFNLTPAGLLPDLPRSFIPYTDDLLIVLCDHSIWQVSGNPLRGGEIDRITGIIGGSFGKPWCVDPEGTIYFHGSRGGIFAMPPKGLPSRISTESIDSDLAEIDLSSYFIEMAWDDRKQALRVYQLPYGNGGTPIQHWVFERRTKGWFPQKIGNGSNTNAQPTAICVFDGDATSDRAILLAGEDQYIGYLDPSARSDRSAGTDDSVAIYSYALIGPIVARGQSDRRSRLMHLEVTLASDRGGCLCEVFVSNVPDDLGLPVWQGQLSPGYNRVRINSVGRYIFLRPSNATKDRDWAFESAVASITDAGRVRQ